MEIIKPASDFPCREPGLDVRDRLGISLAGRLACGVGAIEVDGSAGAERLSYAASLAGGLAESERPNGPYLRAQAYLQEADPRGLRCGLNQALEICNYPCFQAEPGDQ